MTARNHNKIAPNAMKNSMPPHIDVCIPTYKRPELLDLLISSLIKQNTDNLFTYSIIVVDNDHHKSAQEVVVKHSATIAIRYFCQPEKNISLTRNMAVMQSRGDYIAFIDDDEYPCEDWLRLLYLCLLKYKADCVQGPVISYFPDETPPWIIRSGFMNRRRFSTGTALLVGRTGNCLIRSQVIKKFKGPFDPDLGLTGGEDTNFFNALLQDGHTMVWCDEAQVFEFVSPKRASIKWMLQRSFRGGNTYIIEKNLGAGLGGKFINLGLSTIKLCTMLTIAPICLLLGLIEVRFFIKPITKLTEYCGQIAAFTGFRYKEYQ